MKRLSGAEREPESFVASAIRTECDCRTFKGANEALHISTDQLHVISYTAGLSGTMNRLSAIPPNRNTCRQSSIETMLDQASVK